EASLERALAQERRGEGVDRGHRGALEVRGRGQETLALRLVRGRGERVLDLLAQTELQLPRRLLAEGDRHDAVERRAARADEGEDAAHQARGLARSRPGFEEEGRVEVAEDPVAGGLVGGARGHTLATGPDMTMFVATLLLTAGDRRIPCDIESSTRRK